MTRQHGPVKAEKMLRWSTRIARLLGAVARRRPLVATPISSQELADYLGCSYETVKRVIGSFNNPDLGGRMAWAFQSFHFVVFIRYRRNLAAKNAHPMFHVISRNSLHRIGGIPGKIRARLRQKTARQWHLHLSRIRKLAWAKILSGIKRAKGKHNGFPPEKQVGLVKARPPPKGSNRPASRFGSIAVEVQGQYDRIPGAPRILLHGWLLNRFADWHSRARVLACLRHAVAVMPPGLYFPKNPAAWVCAVAQRHLEADGLHPRQRRREISEGRPLTRSTSKVDCAPAAAGEVTVIRTTDFQGNTFEMLMRHGRILPGSYRKI